MAANFNIRITFNAMNLGVAQNTFTFRDTFAATRPDAVLLADALNWMEAFYAPISPYLDSQMVFMGGQVDEVAFVAGKLEIIRNVGTISPAISGTQNAQGTALTTALSLLAKTATPKVRGGKRLGAFTENHMVDALWTNTLLTQGVTATAVWIGGPSSVPGGSTAFEAGVMSTALQGFAKFTGQGSVTNVPGTQVTRKPLRGA